MAIMFQQEFIVSSGVTKLALDYKMRLGDETSISWLKIHNGYVEIKVIKSKDNTLHFDIGESITKEEYFQRKLAGIL